MYLQSKWISNLTIRLIEDNIFIEFYPYLHTSMITISMYRLIIFILKYICCITSICKQQITSLSEIYLRFMRFKVRYIISIRDDKKWWLHICSHLLRKSLISLTCNGSQTHESICPYVTDSLCLLLHNFGRNQNSIIQYFSVYIICCVSTPNDTKMVSMLEINIQILISKHSERINKHMTWIT